jgi:hypothetical protein
MDLKVEDIVEDMRKEMEMSEKKSEFEGFDPTPEQVKELRELSPGFSESLKKTGEAFEELGSATDEEFPGALAYAALSLILTQISQEPVVRAVQAILPDTAPKDPEGPVGPGVDDDD